MLNEEEMEVIDILNKCLFWFVGEKCEIGKDEIRKILKLVEDQQKEIEELKEKDTHITKETVEFVNSHYISKDTIREKIKTLNEVNKNADEIEAIFNIKQLQVLQELLEEN